MVTLSLVTTPSVQNKDVPLEIKQEPEKGGVNTSCE